MMNQIGMNIICLMIPILSYSSQQKSSFILLNLVLTAPVRGSQSNNIIYFPELAVSFLPYKMATLFTIFASKTFTTDEMTPVLYRYKKMNTYNRSNFFDKFQH